MEEVIRKEIESLVQTPTSSSIAERAVVASRQLDLLNSLALGRPDPELPITSVIVASHWVGATDDPTGGILIRAGIAVSTMVQAASGANFTADRLCVCACSPEIATQILAQRPVGRPPVVLSGGADLLRWADKRVCDNELVEIIGVGRLRYSNLRWWFNSVRGLEFHDEASYRTIEKMTSGIPLLVDLLDRLFMRVNPEGGVDINPSAFERVSIEFKNGLPELARNLCNGNSQVRLESREIEILRMVHAASSSCQNNRDLREFLTEGWDLLVEETGMVNPPAALSAADRSAVSVLQELGLLPKTDGADSFERLTPLLSGDAVELLIDQMRSVA